MGNYETNFESTFLKIYVTLISIKTDNARKCSKNILGK